MPIRISGSTGISGLDGSATTPVLQGASANSGIYYSGNTVFVSTSGTNAMTIGPTGNVAFANSSVSIGGQTISSATGMRNRIINGDMKIDQRYAGSAVTVSSAASEWYIVDRTQIEIGGISGTFGTVQRVTDAPTGFSNSLKYTSNSSITYNGSIGWMGLNQRIEGQNLQDFAWGTAGAKPVTLSFWVKASLTGTYTINLSTYNGTQSRFNNITYTIESANTWEYKSLTFAGDTSASGGIANDNGSTGWLRVYWHLGGQAAAATTTSFNTWFNSDGTKRAATNQINMLGTNGATFYLTGVQLELGSVATPFEFRHITLEAQLCRRYYTDQNQALARGMGTNGLLFQFTPQPPMRTTPTAVSLRSTWYVESDPWATACSVTSPVIALNHVTAFGGDVRLTGTFSPTLTYDRFVLMGADNMAWSAEL